MAEIASRLQEYRTEEFYEEGDYKFTLVTEVVGLAAKANTLRGVYSNDNVIQVFHRGKIIPTPRTVEALFSFTQYGTMTFLTIVEKKRVANFIANKLSEILFQKIGGILEVRISPETLKRVSPQEPGRHKNNFFR